MSLFNKLAKLICQKEGLKKQVNIAQVKEVLKILLKDEQCNTIFFYLYFGPIIEEAKTIMDKELLNANSKQKTVSKNKNKRK